MNKRPKVWASFADAKRKTSAVTLAAKRRRTTDSVSYVSHIKKKKSERKVRIFPFWCGKRVRSEKQSMTVFHERSKQSKEKLSKAAPYENFDYATLLGNLQVPRRGWRSCDRHPLLLLSFQQK